MTYIFSFLFQVERDLMAEERVYVFGAQFSEYCTKIYMQFLAIIEILYANWVILCVIALSMHNCLWADFAEDVSTACADKSHIFIHFRKCAQVGI